ncbi:MAG: maturase, partial [Candidatus Dormibacteria bacterium]
VWRLDRLRLDAETSMLMTLAAKHQSTVSKIAARHKAKIETPHGLRTCFEAKVVRDGKQPLVARFGGIPLKRDRDAALADRIPDRMPYPRKELIRRLLASRCELCENPGTVVVHQVRKLANLGKPGQGQPTWAALMVRKQRKTLVVCHPCHDAIHHGQPVAATA